MYEINTDLGGRPLLTIAIPTYNRANCLDLNLTRIREEILRLNENQRKLIRVYVSNNASTDHTAHILSKHQLGEAGEFEVVCNSENIGGERNVAQCYKAATTPYVWVLGDDDVILPGGLQKVLDILQKKNVDILYVNNYWFTNDYTLEPRCFAKQGVVLYESALDFARRTNVMLTFISGLVIKSGINVEKYSSVVEGGNLPQMSWVLPLLRDGKCFAVIEDWVVAAKGANSGGYGLVKVFGHNLVSITNDILKDKPSVAKIIQNGTIVNFFPGFVLEFRKGSSKFSDQEMAGGLKSAFGDNWRYHFFLAPLVRLPLPIASYYNLFLKAFRRLFGALLV